MVKSPLALNSFTPAVGIPLHSKANGSPNANALVIQVSNIKVNNEIVYNLDNKKFNNDVFVDKLIDKYKESLLKTVKIKNNN